MAYNAWAAAVEGELDGFSQINVAVYVHEHVFFCFSDKKRKGEISAHNITLPIGDRVEGDVFGGLKIV